MNKKKIKRTKIENIKIVYCKNIDLITKHYKKKWNSNCCKIVGYCNHQTNTIITSDTKTILHELFHIIQGQVIHHFETIYPCIYMRFIIEEREKLKMVYKKDKRYLNYRLRENEILAYYTENTFDVLVDIKQFTANLRKLKRLYSMNTFKGLLLRILARYKYFTKLYEILKELNRDV